MNTIKLERLQACYGGIMYAKSQKSIISAWKNCERGDWMLWLAQRLNVDDKKLTMAKAMCAKQVEHLIKDQRSKDALQACFDYANGKITRKELNAAANVACDDIFNAANVAATNVACDDIFNAANVAATNVASAAYADAKQASLRKSADICREYLTEEVLTAYKKLR